MKKNSRSRDPQSHLFDEREKVASRAELENEPHVVPRLVPVVELEDVGAAEAVNHLGGARRHKRQHFTRRIDQISELMIYVFQGG